MVEPVDPIESLRESFERIEPGEASRARWIERVQSAERLPQAPVRAEPVPWRLIAGSGLAAAAALALFAALAPEGTGWSASDMGRSVASSIWSMSDVAGERVDSMMLAQAAPPGAMSPQVLMNDESVRQLLEWQLPSLGDLDLGVNRVWNEVSSAILRPITRLGAQLEAG